MTDLRDHLERIRDIRGLFASSIGERIKMLLSARSELQKTIKNYKDITQEEHMNVNLVIKDWRLTAGKLTGTYEVLANGKSIAKQDFNSYGGTDINFSADTLAKVAEINAAIEREIASILN